MVGVYYEIRLERQVGNKMYTFFNVRLRDLDFKLHVARNFWTSSWKEWGVDVLCFIKITLAAIDKLEWEQKRQNWRNYTELKFKFAYIHSLLVNSGARTHDLTLGPTCYPPPTIQIYCYKYLYGYLLERTMSFHFYIPVS